MSDDGLDWLKGGQPEVCLDLVFHLRDKDKSSLSNHSCRSVLHTHSLPSNLSLSARPT